MATRADAYVTGLKRVHELLAVQAQGWMPLPRFKERWQAAYGCAFDPMIFDYDTVDEFFDALHEHNYVRTAYACTGTRMLCAADGLCALMDPCEVSLAIIRRYFETLETLTY